MHLNYLKNKSDQCLSCLNSRFLDYIRGLCKLICTSLIHETSKTEALCLLVIHAEQMIHLAIRQKIKGVVH